MKIPYTSVLNRTLVLFIVAAFAAVPVANAGSVREHFQKVETNNLNDAARAGQNTQKRDQSLVRALAARMYGMLFGDVGDNEFKEEQELQVIDVPPARAEEPMLRPPSPRQPVIYGRGLRY